MVFTVIPYYFFLLQLTHCRTALQCVYRASSLDRLRAKPCANKPNYFIAFLTVKLLTSPTNIDPVTKTCNIFSSLKALLLFAFNQFPKLRGKKLLTIFFFFFGSELRKTSEFNCGTVIFFINFSSTIMKILNVASLHLSLIFHQLYFEIMNILNSLFRLWIVSSTF